MGPNLTGANRAKRHREGLGGQMLWLADIERKVPMLLCDQQYRLVPTTQGVSLIINRESGQWGTSY